MLECVVGDQGQGRPCGILDDQKQMSKLNKEERYKKKK